jgi:hypothetical protein
MLLGPARVLSGILVALPLLFAAHGGWAEEAASPVVVELFTSQGCSSCPPADAYLGDLAKRQDILALGLHVDYWNFIGWTDPYSSKFATQRQHDYAGALNLDSLSTPQMVINGTAQGVGSDRQEIEGLIRAAKTTPALHPSLTIASDVGGGLAIHIGGEAGGTTGGVKWATVWLVVYDSEHTTAVARGENSGRVLTDYQVVRSFRSIGIWTGVPLDISVAPEDVALRTGGAAVLLQTDAIGPIIAAAVLKPGG